LELLSRISMFYNELTERLTDTVASSLFGHFIEVIIGKIKLVPNLSSICSEALPWSNSLSWVVFAVRHQGENIENYSNNLLV